MAAVHPESDVVTLTLEMARELFPEGEMIEANVTTYSSDGGFSLRDFAVLQVKGHYPKLFRLDEALNNFKLTKVNDDYPVLITLHGKTITVAFDPVKVRVRRGVTTGHSHTFE